MSHYLDYAATAAIRPPEVAEAVARFLTDVGATPGRGGYGRALAAGRIALQCRRALQEVLGLEGDPGRIAFLQNATQGINAALWGLLRPGDALVVTAYDHNAVLRPAAHLASERAVEVRMAHGRPDGGLDVAELDHLLGGARLLVVNAASNVLGTRLPLRELSARAHDAGALVLADVAQAAGNFPLSLGEDGADLVAFTGHKGLLGPQGTGGLWVREGIEVEPMLRGGTGGDSRVRTMPAAMPDRLEAGTVNVPGVAGLLAGTRAVLRRGVAVVHAREAELKDRLHRGLAGIAGVRVLSPACPEGVPIVTVTVRGVDSAWVAERLDREWNVDVRAGLHCAPEAHRVLGTLETGAVRFSIGWASTEDDVDRAIDGITAIAGER